MVPEGKVCIDLALLSYKTLTKTVFVFFFLFFFQSQQVGGLSHKMYDKSVPVPRRGQYTKVNQEEDDRKPVDISDRRARRQRTLAREAKRKKTIESIQTKIWAIVWTAAMLAVIYFTDFFLVLLTSDRVNRTWFNVSMLCWGIDISCMMYLAVYLPWKGIDLEWNVYCPRVIPVATGAMVLGSFTLMMSTWPVWGFMTPFILGIIGVGCLMSLHFIPACRCCE